jgi:hypothetical protein
LTDVQAGSGAGQVDLRNSGSESTAEQLRDKGQEATASARDAAGRAGEQTKTFMRDQFEQRMSQGGDQVSSTAEDLRSIGQELRNKDKEGPAKLAEQLADRIERVADYMKSADADRILRDSEEFGRQRPWAVMVGGLALGFALSRFLKVSSGSRYGSTSSSRYPLELEESGPRVPPGQQGLTTPVGERPSISGEEGLPSSVERPSTSLP